MDNIEIEELIDKCANKFWRRFEYICPDLSSYIGREDIKSQSYLIYVTSMESYGNSTIPLPFFVARSISNGLKNFVRDEMKHHVDRNPDHVEDLWGLSGPDPTDALDLIGTVATQLDETEKKVLEMTIGGYSQHEIRKELKIAMKKLSEMQRNVLTKVTE